MAREVYVTPKPGLIVRDQKGARLHERGDWREDSTHWRQHEAHGSVQITDEKPDRELKWDEPLKKARAY